MDRHTSWPVELRAPHSPDECRRRLAQVTTTRSALSWHTDAANVKRPDPRLRGTIGPEWISVARWRDAAGRNSFAPWLNARLEGPVDETTLTGRVGLARSVASTLPTFGATAGLILVVILVSGVAGLARGQLHALPFVLGPLGMALFLIAFMTAGFRSLGQKTLPLLAEVNALLDSTVVSGGEVTLGR
jgi:hypothetical protein